MDGLSTENRNPPGWKGQKETVTNSAEQGKDRPLIPDFPNSRNQGSGVAVNWETGADIYTLLCIKQIANENLLCGTGNSTERSAMT